ncbi:unnamed protein product [Linum tenue]|uniref:Exostosin GT47 domain-containing protein n=1 Tax=Linum tenue TaxID=586396 RepID=A0AAV0QGE5_9ROSI|nr:unnamed protein product [Linum tenue]
MATAMAAMIQRSHVGRRSWRFLIVIAMAVFALAIVVIVQCSSISYGIGRTSSWPPLLEEAPEASSSFLVSPINNPGISDDSKLGEIQKFNLVGNTSVLASSNDEDFGDDIESISNMEFRDRSRPPAVEEAIELEPKNREPLQIVSMALSKNPEKGSLSLSKRLGRKKHPTTISQMNSQLHHNLVSAISKRPQRPSARDRELLSAKLQIVNAPIVKNTPGLHASSFWNVSRFKRSYELMERMLKVYIYKEGEKPVFHQSRMRGIYASEGWFMKLMKESKKFGVRDPRKAHLFYIPFSSEMLRKELYRKSFQSVKELEEHLKSYVNHISHKYSFWNRSSGADHFIAGCHDWAPKLTSNHMMSNCIRALCNANVAKGFKIGKDTTLPVTSIRSQERPLQDIGGKPPSERHILAFFAGGKHGSLRPVLLQHWEASKDPDMKILGPMLRDVESKRIYREYMKSSKYCICAKGYEVHTPRIVEAIYYECVPVIISDNYVPPFFEVLNWEEFAVFVAEKDIPRLREILVEIPEDKYVAMQSSVRMVQQHFLWHKAPLRYDLFHMILHSVWHNRVFGN